MLKELTPAQIKIDEKGVPYAEIFSDCYFSKQDGLAETHYVFLAGNDLPQQWQNKKQFVIGETGFGTGLNFLATWQAWQADPQRCQTLHYIAFEKYPIHAEQLRTLQQTWPTLAVFSDALLEQYPPVLAGFHRLQLADKCVQLTLCFGDILEGLAEINAPINAWYLDGFAPARNPDMWSLPVMQALAHHSATQASFATFTAASVVQRHLSSAGFSVNKRAGYGKKREMLYGTLASTPTLKQPACPLVQPWFARPTFYPVIRQASVIGGGVAGCQIAFALAQRGWQVSVFERHATLASAASGNRAGVLTPKMTAEPDWGERFYRTAFLFALRQMKQLAALGIEWQACGALQLNHQERETKRWQALQARHLPSDFLQLLEREQASACAGIELPAGASYFPQGGWLAPASLCHALCQHPQISVKLNTAIEQLRYDGTAWHLATAQHTYTSPIVIIASGAEAGHFSQTADLPFSAVRGQTTQAMAQGLSQRLRTVLGHEGYITPAIGNTHIFGATFERDQTDAQPLPERDTANWQQLQQYLPTLAQSLACYRSGHCAVRVTVPDRYPVVGGVPDFAWMKDYYAGLQHGQKHKQWPDLQYQPGLYLSAAYGSRGLTTSALCSELLGALIEQEPLPLEQSLYQKLHPARFFVRRLQQNRT